MRKLSGVPSCVGSVGTNLVGRLGKSQGLAGAVRRIPPPRYAHDRAKTVRPLQLSFLQDVMTGSRVDKGGTDRLTQLTRCY
jgi:hypothetical protein